MRIKSDSLLLASLFSYLFLFSILGLHDLYQASKSDYLLRQKKDAVITPTNLALAKEVSKDRSPASLRVSQQILNYDCFRDSKGTVFTVESSVLRLKGKGCGKHFDAQRLKIVNQTNGFTASIFSKNSESYETDLIQLNKGYNLIQIEYSQGSTSGTLKKALLSITSL